MKVLCIGKTSYNVNICLDKFPQENTKYFSKDISYCGSGSASTIAYLLGKWGVDTYFHSCVGYDSFGNEVLSELKNMGVNTDNVFPTSSTGVNFVLINKSNGSRTLFATGDSGQILEPVSYNFNPDIIVSDGACYEATKNAFLMYPNSIKIIDTGRISDKLVELCKLANYVICSKGFAEMVSKLRFDFNNLSTLKNVYNAVENEFQNNLIITLEANGCLYKERKDLKLVSALNVKVVDRTGAGDIFCGAFVYSLANGYALDKSVNFASIAAGLSITKVGTRDSVFSLEDVKKEYEKNN